MRTATLIIVLLVCPLAIAADVPQSKAARTALDRYATAKAKLDADYQSRLDVMTRTLTQDLQAALKTATRAGDLAEANAIQAVLDQMLGKVSTFTIDAAKDWQPTVQVKKGQKFIIEARGEWGYSDLRFGPDGFMQSDGPATNYLESRLGNGEPFKVGSRFAGTAPADGIISMRMPMHIFNAQRTTNTGSLAVTVRLFE